MGLVLGWGYVLVLLSFFDMLPDQLLHGYGFVLRVILVITDTLGSFDDLVITRISWGKASLVLSLMAILSVAGWVKIGRVKGRVIGFCCLILLDGYSVWETAKTAKTNTWIIPHRPGESSIWNQNGFHLTVYSTNPEALSPLADQYATAVGIKSLRYNSLGNSYTIGNVKLLRIDSTGCYPRTNYQPDILLLSDSPPIHLGMALARLKPGLVIADGSNYPSDLARWKKTSRDYGIPFHATGEKGAFQQRISINP
jgi:competence protein ComEC